MRRPACFNVEGGVMQRTAARRLRDPISPGRPVQSGAEGGGGRKSPSKLAGAQQQGADNVT